MQSYNAVAVDVKVQGYGVVLHPGDMAHYPRDVAPLSADEDAAVDRVCAFVEGKNVIDLERLATAAWIRRRQGLSDTQKVVERTWRRSRWCGQ